MSGVRLGVGQVWSGLVRHGSARLGKVRSGLAWSGRARCCVAKQGN